MYKKMHSFKYNASVVSMPILILLCTIGLLVLTGCRPKSSRPSPSSSSTSLSFLNAEIAQLGKTSSYSDLMPIIVKYYRALGVAELPPDVEHRVHLSIAVAMKNNNYMGRMVMELIGTIVKDLSIRLDRQDSAQNEMFSVIFHCYMGTMRVLDILALANSPLTSDQKAMLEKRTTDTLQFSQFRPRSTWLGTKGNVEFRLIQEIWAVIANPKSEISNEQLVRLLDLYEYLLVIRIIKEIYDPYTNLLLNKFWGFIRHCDPAYRGTRVRDLCIAGVEAYERGAQILCQTGDISQAIDDFHQMWVNNHKILSLQNEASNQELYMP